MPITVNHKKPAGYVVFRTTSTGSLKLNTVGASVGANAINELVNSMSISEIFWSVDASNRWTIARGSNTVAELSGTGWHDYQASGIRLEQDAAQLTSNVVATLSGGTCTLVLKLHKVSGE